MHSLIVLWCWAMALGLGALKVARSRATVPALVGLCLLTAAWMGVQLGINRQLAATLDANPSVGIDVSAILDAESVPPENARCDTLTRVRERPDADLFISLLNREYTELHGVPYCPLEVTDGDG